MGNVNKEISDFERWCQASWGTTVRNYKEIIRTDIPVIRDCFDFDKISSPLKAHIAEKLILESCKRIGSFYESGDVTWYIRSFGRELRGDDVDFAGRRIQPLKAALLLIAHSQFSSALPLDREDFHHILAGGGAMSAMYLLAQLEFLYRKKGRYLKEDGTIKYTIPEQLCKKAELKANSKRVNRIEQAFILYLYRNTTSVGQRFRTLEKKLCITERFKNIRNHVMHGELPDPFVEGRFFGLLIAMLYYGDS
ncbi:hypothetical protein ACFLUS_02495 [Chloroflexota bacterium]